MQLQNPLSVIPVAAEAALLAVLLHVIWCNRSTRRVPFGIAIEDMQEAAIVLDMRNHIVDLNSAAQQFTDAQRAKIIGRPFAEVFSTWPLLVEYCRNPEENNEKVIAGSSKESRYFDLHILPLSRHAGRVTNTARLITLHDITERILAEKALEESERHFRNIFAEVPIGMAIVDLEGHVLQVNKAFCEMLEYDEQELIGLSLSAITHPDDIGADMFFAGKALSGEMSSYKVEKRYLKKNREMLWADLTATILRNQRGKAIYGLVMLENIIERKRAKLLEEERYHVAYELHDGLAQVAVSVHQHLQALASRYHPRSPQARQELDMALELAQHAVREARRLIAGLRPTVLDDFGLVMALRLQIETQRHEGWKLIFDEALGTERLPRAIETTLFGVAQEALTNIRKHSGTTRARLALQRRDLTIRLEVQDWGCGFEPRTLFKVYRPGEHVGIRAMQERVELLGGRLLISSHPGFGTLVVAEISILPSNAKERDDVSNAAKIDADALQFHGHLAEEDDYTTSSTAKIDAASLLLPSYLTERNEKP